MRKIYRRSGPMLWIDHWPATTARRSAAGPLVSRLRTDSVVGQWQHVAATFDGTTPPLHGRRRGGRAPSPAASGARTPGGSGPTAPAGCTRRCLDDVRVYSRALSAARSCSTAPCSDTARPADGRPRPASPALTATESPARRRWAGRRDWRRRRTRYNLHHSTRPDSLLRRATGLRSRRVGLHNTGLAAGTCYYKVTAEDGAATWAPRRIRPRRP